MRHKQVSPGHAAAKQRNKGLAGAGGPGRAGPGRAEPMLNCDGPGRADYFENVMGRADNFNHVMGRAEIFETLIDRACP